MRQCKLTFAEILESARGPYAYESDLAAYMLQALEGGDAGSSGVPAIFAAATKCQTTGDDAFMKTWLTAIALEEQDIVSNRAEIWVLTGLDLPGISFMLISEAGRILLSQIFAPGISKCFSHASVEKKGCKALLQ